MAKKKPSKKPSARESFSYWDKGAAAHSWMSWYFAQHDARANKSEAATIAFQVLAKLVANGLTLAHVQALTTGPESERQKSYETVLRDLTEKVKGRRGP